jgi:hypothetical protein
MRLPRFVKRAALVVALSAVILVAGVSAYLRIEQYRFRRQAERLLSDMRELELKKASAAEVRLVVRKWGFEEWRGLDKPCTQDKCVYSLQLMPEPARTHGFTDPFVPAPIAHIFDWLGLRPSLVQSWIEIRGKALRSVSFSVDTLGRGCTQRGGSGCMLLGDVGTKQETGSWSKHDQPDVRLKHTLLHPAYLVGTLPASLNDDTGGSPVVIVWAEFSPDASAADLSRLMRFDLSCLTRFRLCKDRDLMPTVWAQSVEDIRESPKSLTCTPELSKRVAQLSDVIAVVRPKTVDLSSPRYDGRPPRLRNLEIVNVIRKPEHLRLPVRSDIDVDVYGPEMLATADTGAPVRASQQYVFLLQIRNDSNIGWFALYPCGALSFNDANLAMVRDAAASIEATE